MPELDNVKKQKTAGYVNPNYNRQEARRKRLEEEEKELEELIKGSQEDPQEQEEEIEEQEEELETQPEEEPKVKEEEKLSGEEKSFKKRYGDLRRHMQKKEKEWEEKFESLKSQSKSVAPPKSDEDIDEWKKKYPDVAGIVETIARKQANEMFEKANSQIKDLDEYRYEAERVKAEAEIRKAHDDFDDLRDADEFHDWANEQPKWVQDALYENDNDPKSVIRVIDLYKVDKGITRKDRKKAEQDAAKSVSRKTRTKVDDEGTNGIVKESEINRMSMEEYEANEERIMEAMANGKFIYDISGGAR